MANTSKIRLHLRVKLLDYMEQLMKGKRTLRTVRMILRMTQRRRREKRSRGSFTKMSLNRCHMSTPWSLMCSNGQRNSPRERTFESGSTKTHSTREKSTALGKDTELVL